jgi:hypothetical protein
LESPETGGKNRRYRDLNRRQRPHTRHLNPRKGPHFAGYSSETRKGWFVSECVVVDAASIEPVSTGQIPVYQGKEPGILPIRGVRNHLPANKCSMFQKVVGQIPCEERTGNSFVESGTFIGENGKSARTGVVSAPNLDEMQEWLKTTNLNNLDSGPSLNKEASPSAGTPRGE